MNNFRRDNMYFSLCGLSCGLCSMRLSNHCPGCGGGEHHSCAIANCSLEHDAVEYCFLCDDFPCTRYEDPTKIDSFLTSQNRLKDMRKAEHMGIEAYTKEQMEKVNMLNCILENHSAGGEKTLFCIAFNLMDIQDIRTIMDLIAPNSDTDRVPAKDKVAMQYPNFKE